MLLAASESAVTKKPRLRLMMRRSSSVRPLGSFQVAMSRDMFTSCGIQWLAQVARYFSQAHLYLNGTSWFTSVWPLMMRFSATLTRRSLRATTELAALATWAAAVCRVEAGAACAGTAEASEGCAAGAITEAGERGVRALPRACSGAVRGTFVETGRGSSSQTNMGLIPVRGIIRVLCPNTKRFLTS